MGMGVRIEVTAASEPIEIVEVTCSKCGSKLRLARLKDWAKEQGWFDITETEQHCPVCGASACEEDRPKEKVKERQRSNFFSFFGG